MTDGILVSNTKNVVGHRFKAFGRFVVHVEASKSRCSRQLIRGHGKIQSKTLTVKEE